MKTKVFLITSIVLLFAGCNNFLKQQTDVVTSSDITSDSLFIKNEKHSSGAFYRTLLLEIRNFIDDFGDCGMVIPVRIERQKEQCHLFITIDNYYDSRFLIGYQVIEEKMIAYYYDYLDENTKYQDYYTRYFDSDSIKQLVNYENNCSNGLINISKLEKTTPNGFLNENSYDVMNNYYEPIGRHYIIHSRDSLELVFEGYY